MCGKKAFLLMVTGGLENEIWYLINPSHLSHRDAYMRACVARVCVFAALEGLRLTPEV